MRSIQFATLAIAHGKRVETAHVPLLVTQKTQGVTLEGHLAIDNPLCSLAEQTPEALAIFHGPQAYIRPGWLPTKKEHGRAVPTWNYVVVHARGLLLVERDPSWLREHVMALTERNENGRPEPWSVEDLPPDYTDAMLKAIIGIRVEVSALEGVWKMIQHHPQRNRVGVIDGLVEEGGSDEVAVANVMLDLETESKSGASKPQGRCSLREG